MRRALIVIDMQQGSFNGATPRHDAEGLVRRLNALASKVRAEEGLVVFVQHEGPPGDPHHPSQPGFALLPDLHVASADRLIRKSSCDAFLDTALEGELRGAGVRELIVTGCATDYCVDTTIRSALAKGYGVIAPSDGHTTVDRPHLAAAKIIEHHNAIWSDFISPAGSAKVIACNQI